MKSDISLTILSGSGFPGKDPFVKLFYPITATTPFATTETKRNDFNPTWNETYTLKIQNDGGKDASIVRLAVFDLRAGADVFVTNMLVDCSAEGQQQAASADMPCAVMVEVNHGGKPAQKTTPTLNASQLGSQPPPLRTTPPSPLGSDGGGPGHKRVASRETPRPKSPPIPAPPTPGVPKDERVQAHHILSPNAPATPSKELLASIDHSLSKPVQPMAPLSPTAVVAMLSTTLKHVEGLPDGKGPAQLVFYNPVEAVQPIATMDGIANGAYSNKEVVFTPNSSELLVKCIQASQYIGEGRLDLRSQGESIRVQLNKEGLAVGLFLAQKQFPVGNQPASNHQHGVTVVADRSPSGSRPRGFTPSASPARGLPPGGSPQRQHERTLCVVLGAVKVLPRKSTWYVRMRHNFQFDNGANDPFRSVPLLSQAPVFHDMFTVEAPNKELTLRFELVDEDDHRSAPGSTEHQEQVLGGGAIVAAGEVAIPVPQLPNDGTTASVAVDLFDGKSNEPMSSIDVKVAPVAPGASLPEPPAPDHLTVLATDHDKVSRFDQSCTINLNVKQAAFFGTQHHDVPSHLLPSTYVSLTCANSRACRSDVLQDCSLPQYNFLAQVPLDPHSRIMILNFWKVKVGKGGNGKETSVATGNNSNASFAFNNSMHSYGGDGSSTYPQQPPTPLASAPVAQPSASGDELVGQVEFSPYDVCQRGKAWYKVLSKGIVAGCVLLEWSTLWYAKDVSAIMPSVRPTKLWSQVHLEVVEARELPGADLGGGCDPYCKVQVLPLSLNQAEIKTKVARGTTAPSWKKKATISLKARETAGFVFTILDDDVVGEDNFIGMHVFRSDSALWSTPTGEAWFPLEGRASNTLDDPNSGPGKEGRSGLGSILVRWRFEGEVDDPQSTSAHHTGGGTSSLLPRMQDPSTTWTLKLKGIAAKALPLLDPSRLVQPELEVQFLNQIKRLPSAIKTQAPVFDGAITFDVKAPSSLELCLRLFDTAFGNEQFIGEARVDLSNTVTLQAEETFDLLPRPSPDGMLEPAELVTAGVSLGRINFEWELSEGGNSDLWTTPMARPSITLKIHQGRGIKGRKGECQVILTDVNDASSKQETKIIRKSYTPHPQFDDSETFTFESTVASKGEGSYLPSIDLKLQVKNRNKIDTVGFATIRSAVLPKRKGRQWLSIMDNHTVTAQLEVEWWHNYAPIAAVEETVEVAADVLIKVVQCRHLVPPLLPGAVAAQMQQQGDHRTCVASVIIGCGKASYTARSHEPSIHPHLNEEFCFSVSREDIISEVLRVQVVDESNNDSALIGYGMLQLSELMSSSGCADRWVKLYRDDGKSFAGEVLIKSMGRSFATKKKQPVATDASGPTDPKDATNVAGIKLDIQRAHDLVGLDLGGASDPYAVITWGDQQCTTRVVPGSLAPVWNESYHLLKPSTGVPLYIHIFDKDTLGDDQDLMGSVQIDCEQLLSAETETIMSLSNFGPDGAACPELAKRLQAMQQTAHTAGDRSSAGQASLGTLDLKWTPLSMTEVSQITRDTNCAYPPFLALRTKVVMIRPLSSGSSLDADAIRVSLSFQEKVGEHTKSREINTPTTTEREGYVISMKSAAASIVVNPTPITVTVTNPHSGKVLAQGETFVAAVVPTNGEEERWVTCFHPHTGTPFGKVLLTVSLKPLTSNAVQGSLVRLNLAEFKNLLMPTGDEYKFHVEMSCAEAHWRQKTQPFKGNAMKAIATGSGTATSPARRRDADEANEDDISKESVVATSPLQRRYKVPSFPLSYRLLEPDQTRINIAIYGAGTGKEEQPMSLNTSQQEKASTVGDGAGSSIHNSPRPAPSTVPVLLAHGVLNLVPPTASGSNSGSSWIELYRPHTASGGDGGDSLSGSTTMGGNSIGQARIQHIFDKVTARGATADRCFFEILKLRSSQPDALLRPSVSAVFQDGDGKIQRFTTSTKPAVYPYWYLDRFYVDESLSLVRLEVESQATANFSLSLGCTSSTDSMISMSSEGKRWIRFNGNGAAQTPHEVLIAWGSERGSNGKQDQQQKPAQAAGQQHVPHTTLGVTLRVTEARNLTAADSNGLADPFAIVMFEKGRRSEKAKTDFIPKTLNPQWNQNTFHFEMSPLDRTVSGCGTVKLMVCDHDERDEDDMMGTGVLDVSNEDINGEKWVALQDRKGGPAGEVRVAWEVQRLLTTAANNEKDSAAAPGTQSKNVTVCSPGDQVRLRVLEARKLLPVQLQTATSPAAASLTVPPSCFARVTSLVLQEQQGGGTVEPLLKTDVVSNTDSPVFSKSTNTIEVEGAAASGPLSVTLWHRSPSGPGVIFMGEAIVDPAAFDMRPTWVPLNAREGNLKDKTRVSGQVNPKHSSVGGFGELKVQFEVCGDNEQAGGGGMFNGVPGGSSTAWTVAFSIKEVAYIQQEGASSASYRKDCYLRVSHLPQLEETMISNRTPQQSLFTVGPMEPAAGESVAFSLASRKRDDSSVFCGCKVDLSGLSAIGSLNVELQADDGQAVAVLSCSYAVSGWRDLNANAGTGPQDDQSLVVSPTRCRRRRPPASILVEAVDRLNDGFKGKPPVGHQLLLHRGKAFQVGGYCGNSWAVGVQVFSPTSLSWQPLDLRGEFRREGHTVVSHRNHLVVYGGCGPGGLDRNMSSVQGVYEDIKNIFSVGPVGHGSHQHQSDHTLISNIYDDGISGHTTPRRDGLRTPSTSGSHPDLSSIVNASNSATSTQQAHATHQQQHHQRSVAVAAHHDQHVAIAAETTRHTKEHGYYDSTLEFDVGARRWIQKRTSGAKDFRSNHTAIVLQDLMIVFGGWSIRIEERRTGAANTTNSTDEYESPSASPNKSRPGTGHNNTSSSSSRARKKIFKSYASCEYRRNDLACLDLTTGYWSAIQPRNSCPCPPVSGHSAVLIGRVMYVFGGTMQLEEGSAPFLSNELFTFDLDTCEWSHKRKAVNWPAPRTGHSACVASMPAPVPLATAQQEGDDASVATPPPVQTMIISGGAQLPDAPYDHHIWQFNPSSGEFHRVQIGAELRGDGNNTNPQQQHATTVHPHASLQVSSGLDVENTPGAPGNAPFWPRTQGSAVVIPGKSSVMGTTTSPILLVNGGIPASNHTSELDVVWCSSKREVLERRGGGTFCLSLAPNN